MRTLLRLLSAELLKCRRTAILPVALVTPALLALVATLVAKDVLRPTETDSWPWFAGIVFAAWTTLFLPMLTGLLAALVAGVEHRGFGLRHLFTQPVPRRRIYEAKQLLVFGLLAAGWGVLILGLACGGAVLRRTVPGIGFEGAVPWSLLLTAAAAGILASFFAVALQTWVAFLRPGFVLPVATAFLATVVLLVLRGLTPELLPVYPWGLPPLSLQEVSDGLVVMPWAVVGGVGGVCFTLAAASFFARREMP